MIAFCGFAQSSSGRARSMIIPTAVSSTPATSASPAATARCAALIWSTAAPTPPAVTTPSMATRYECMNLAAACSRGATGMTREIQNCAPSRENADDDVPLRLPHSVMNSAVARMTTSGLADVMTFSRTIGSPPSQLPPPTLPPLSIVAISTKMAGNSTTTRTPFSRKIGVRFMIFHSRPKIAATARRPDVTRRDISSRVSLLLFPVVSPSPTSPL